MNDDAIELGRLWLTMRPHVSRRIFGFASGSVCYLTLFDRELEARAAAFQRRIDEGRVQLRDAKMLGLCLEPSDAAVMVRGNEVIVCKGGACAIPLYWRFAAERIAVTTRLPSPSASALSRRGLLAAFSVVAAVLQNDQNLLLASPLAGWTKLRRGAVTVWRGGGDKCKFCETPIDFAEAAVPERLRAYAGIVEELRHQMRVFGATQHGPGRSIFELSGGMDSTLTAWSARRSGEKMVGVSINFPFYEFRFEEEIQIETAKALGAERWRVDGRDLYAYTPCEPRLALEEPAIISMIAKREARFADLARKAGADAILVGEGGDQLLSEPLLEPMRITDRIDRNVMNAAKRPALNAMVQAMRAGPSAFLNRSTLNFSYDARLALAIKERWGTVSRTPFTDLGMAMCAIAYAKWCANQGFNPGKKLLADAFGDILPAAIRERRGKVSWEGVYARTYLANAEALRAEFEACHDALEEIGFDVRWLVRRVGALERLQLTDYGQDDREVMSAYAIAYWLNEKGVRKRMDCDWAD
jgi:hypothetical protein